MFSEKFSESLVALRSLNIRFYLELMREQFPEEASRKAAMDRITALSATFSANDDDLPLPDLTVLLASPAYREFVQVLNDSAPDVAAKAQRILETKEYEERLSRLKKVSLAEYVDELRVVSEDELVSALMNGTIVNAVDDDGVPMPIRSDENYTGAFLDIPTATAWVDADLLAAVIKRFAAADGDLIADPQGLRLRQVVVGGGQLNLNWVDCPFPLGFEGCDFHQWISADHLAVPWLSFDTCDFTPHEQAYHRHGALNAASIVVEHELRFWGCRGLDQLFIPDAHIGSFSPTNPDADAAAGVQRTFRSVIDGATFGQFLIPEDPEAGFRVRISRSVRIETLGGLESETETSHQVADRVFGWLTASEANAGEASDSADDDRDVKRRWWRRAQKKQEPAVTRLSKDVWGQFESALRRSQHSDAATDFGIMAARHATTFEGFRGWLKRVVLGSTVRYFYDNMRALRYLVGLFVVTWVTVLVVALFAPGLLVQSPLANEAMVPGSWLLSIVDTSVWSFLYSIDLILAPISLGLAQTIWPDSIWLSLLFATIKGLSLLLLGLYVVGVTGLVERRGRSE